MRSISILVSSAALFFLYSFQTNECAVVPPANKKIVAFVKSKIGKKVGDGCHGIFEEAYKAAGLYCFGYDFGKEVDYSKDCVFPGDVIAFRNLEISWKRNDSIVGMRFDDDEIDYFILKVKAKGVYTVARTETINGKNKVITSDLEINKPKKGKPKIYRPSKKTPS